MTPSFWWLWRRWNSTVLGVTNSDSAISRVVSPSAAPQWCALVAGDQAVKESVVAPDAELPFPSG